MFAPRSSRRARPARLVLALCLFGLCVPACDLPDVEVIGDESQPIIGGQVDIGDPAVVFLQGADGLCTGTLVADTVVLTAAHCLPQNNVNFGTQMGDFIATRHVVQEYAARNWQGIENWIQGGDIALLRLDSPAPVEIEPMPINTTPLDESYIGTEIRVVGFGVTDGVTGEGVGTKRFVNVDVKGVTGEHITYGDEFFNHCEGDSGGPDFMDFDGTERIVGVIAYGAGDCLGEARSTRPDVYYDILLQEVIDAWSGPCKQDYDCVTEGCRTPDPDCDICGFDGVCATGCDKKDLDCPVSGFQGDPCTSREDCETLLCLEAPEDARVKYCSAECDPEDTFSRCDTPLSTCVPASDGKHYCRFADTTPGVQGYECNENDECRSGICYPPGNGICAEICGDGQPACTEPYSCESVGEGADLCIIPEGGGCCQTTASRDGRSTAGVLLLAGLVALLLTVRTRRRR